MLLSSNRHYRPGGNPGLFLAELAWIPAFAGMTELGGFFVLEIIFVCVFSKENTKSTKLGILNTRNLRVLRDLRGERALSSPLGVIKRTYATPVGCDT
jgi:hypothetical protein